MPCKKEKLLSVNPTWSTFMFRVIHPVLISSRPVLGLRQVPTISDNNRFAGFLLQQPTYE